MWRRLLSKHMRHTRYILFALLTSLPLYASVNIETNPSGAHVRLNTIRAGIAPARVIIQPGSYLLSATLDGHFTTFDNLMIIDDNTPTEVDVDLSPIPATLLIQTTPPQAEISLDGHPSGNTPMLLRGIAPGPLTGIIQSEGYAPLHLRHNIQPGDTQILQLEMQREAAEVTIASDPDGATVKTNGEDRGTTPLQLTDLPAGEIELQVQRDGYRTFTETLSLEAGESRHLNISLLPESTKLEFDSTPQRARVLINDRFRGRTPLRLSNLSIGEHHLTIEHPAYRTIQTNITVHPGDQRALEFEMEVTGGTLTVTTSPPEANILINDILAARTEPDPEAEDDISLPYEIHPLEEGEHVLSIITPGYRQVRDKIDVTSRANIERHYDLESLPDPNYEITTETNVYRGYWSDTNETETITLELRSGSIRSIPRDDATDIRSLR